MATATYLRSPGGGDKTPIKITAGADIAVDEIVVAGNSVVVSNQVIANTATGWADTNGEYIFPKVSGAVIAAGETVFWDVSASEVDDNAATAATGDIQNFAIATEDAGNGVTTVKVLLLPGNGTVT